MPTRYTKDHEWIRLDGDVATVGITEHAQNALGDIVYVELPEIGRVVERGGEEAGVEAGMGASDAAGRRWSSRSRRQATSPPRQAARWLRSTSRSTARPARSTRMPRERAGSSD